jgi:hypothetical protein
MRTKNLVRYGIGICWIGLFSSLASACGSSRPLASPAPSAETDTSAQSSAFVAPTVTLPPVPTAALEPTHTGTFTPTVSPTPNRRFYDFQLAFSFLPPEGWQRGSRTENCNDCWWYPDSSHFQGGIIIDHLKYDGTVEDYAKFIIIAKHMPFYKNSKLVSEEKIVNHAGAPGIKVTFTGKMDKDAQFMEYGFPYWKGILEVIYVRYQDQLTSYDSMIDDRILGIEWLYDADFYNGK